jgi:hypothetical protein
VSLFGKNADRIRKNTLYRVCIDFPLRVFYNLVKLSLRAPKAGLGVFLGLGALSLFALGVGLFFFKPLISTSSGFSMPTAAVLLIAPAAILALQGLFVLWGGRLLVTRAGIWGFLAMVLSMVVILWVLWPFRP